MLNWGMFTYVRIIITIVFALAMIFVFLADEKKKQVFSYLIAVTAFFAVISFIPFENIFYKFDTPQAALEYQTNKQTCEVIETDDMSVMIYKKNDTAISTYISGKSGNGWTLPWFFAEQGKSIELPYEYHNLSMYSCKTSNSDMSVLVIAEYFYFQEEPNDESIDVTVTDTESGAESADTSITTIKSSLATFDEDNVESEIVLSDSINSEYKMLSEFFPTEAGYVIIHYAFIDSNVESLRLNINDIKIEATIKLK